MLPTFPVSDRRRALALLCCAGGALAINGAGLALADDASALAIPAPAPVSLQQRSSLILVSVRPATASAGSGTGAAAPAAATVVAAASPAATSLRRPLSSAEDTAGAMRFYRLSEVDAPAEPAADWALDLESLDALGIGRVAFEVLVSDRGEIVACTVLDADGLSAEQRAALEERLRSTDMRPALRAGLRVASIRHVELYVESGENTVLSDHS